LFIKSNNLQTAALQQLLCSLRGVMSETRSGQASDDWNNRPGQVHGITE